MKTINCVYVSEKLFCVIWKSSGVSFSVNDGRGEKFELQKVCINSYIVMKNINFVQEN